MLRTSYHRQAAAVIAAGLVFAATSAWAERTAGESIDDKTLGTNIKMQLIDDKVAPAGSINVEAYKGVVQLIGFVRSDAERQAAIERASGVKGVEKVVDAMVVVAEKRSFGTTIDDQTIQTKVKLEITGLGADKGLAVVTDVRNGEVLLGGFVGSADDRAEIVARVKAVKGVTRVHDHIGVKG